MCLCVYAEPHTYTVVISMSSASATPLLKLNEPGLCLGRGLCISWQPARGIPGLNPPPTGVIRTAVPDLDRESQERYEVVIQATDMAGQLGGLSGSTTVTIVVTDVNDNPPRFPQSE